MKLLKSQKTFLYDLIERNKFSPSLFSIKEVEGEKGYTIIKYKLENFFFSIDVSVQGDFYFRFSPAETIMVDQHETDNWDFLIPFFHQWLDCLHREIEVVDKWQLLENEIPNITMFENPATDKFTYEEVKLVESKIALLKSKLVEIPLSDEQAAILNHKLDYCIELAKKATKFDWASYFLGVITNIIITLCVTPDNGHLIWEAVKNVFQNFLLK